MGSAHSGISIIPSPLTLKESPALRQAGPTDDHDQDERVMNRSSDPSVERSFGFRRLQRSGPLRVIAMIN